MPDLDVLIIGGGVNGTGIARDCALRGYRVALVEQRDLGAGATGTSSGMIHGGARYLRTDVLTTRLSCIDSGYIQRIAPFLLFRIPLLTPVFPGDPYGLELLETYFEAYDVHQRHKRGQPHTRLTRAEALALEPGLAPNIAGAVTMDEWGIDAFRLCALNALDAAAHGAEIVNHARVTALLREDGRIAGAAVRLEQTGETRTLRAAVTVNAAGPWAPKVAALAGCAVPMRWGKGVHLVVERRVSNIGLVTAAIDGRHIFILPHEQRTLIGCTDDDYYGDPDRIEATQDEVEYLFQGAERVFPGIRQHRLIHVTAGLRPTLHHWGVYEDDLSRDFRIIEHDRQGGPAGLITLIGGKLAMYRYMAEKTTDVIGARLGRTSPCRTHLLPLPGGEQAAEHAPLARDLGRSRADRLIYRHGARAGAIAATIAEDPARGRTLCRCEGVSYAEAQWAIQHEWVRDVDDLARRTRCGLGACQGARCTRAAADLIARTAGGHDEDLAARFRRERWRHIRPVLDYASLAQEELRQQLAAGPDANGSRA